METRGAAEVVIGRQVGIGNTASVYEWGSNEVVKLFHPTEFARSDAEKEARNAELVSELNLKAPRYSGRIEYEGRHGLIYEKIEGPTMLVRIEPNQESVSYHARLMAQLQHEFHQVRVGRESNLKKELLGRLNWTPELSDAEKSRIRDIAAGLPDGDAFCHYDLHPGNIILSPNGPVLIDWMNVLIGDPAADVARSAMIIRSSDLPPDAPEWLQNSWLADRSHRLFFYEQYWNEYQALSGMNQQNVEDWLAPTWAARILEVDRSSKNDLLTLIRERITA
ncbi:phosphotransferase family protein [Cohnella sp. AR92]|uniref:phosphotransferase family protein n=1 Tax=Cohnella sp. AR92 TaxID=648716 RepID=UPI000F8CCF1E|nr:aminoglycoside phosphotransferase family protein [Cohnella sp. AR92]RUS46866.1 aminoglycoside phosphotransferase family protein [Cohnella sp. AR92]